MMHYENVNVPHLTLFIKHVHTSPLDYLQYQLYLIHLPQCLASHNLSNMQTLSFNITTSHNLDPFQFQYPFPKKFYTQKYPLKRSQVQAISNHNNLSSIEVYSRKNGDLTSSILEPWRETRVEKERESFGPRMNDNELVDCWRQIQGEDDWVGLLDPMDHLLRTELIRYGELAQACYDAFDFDPYSKYCGSCKYPREMFFKGLEMENHGYDVTRYLYATSNINLPNFFRNSRWPKVWSKNANWIGYVAVSNDEMSKKLGRRDIIISWRGTVTRLEWVHDLMDFLRPVSDENIPCPDREVKAESGFMDLYTDKDLKCRYCKFSAREQILTEIKRLSELYHNEEVSITITGHSLGSALAILSAYDIAETGIHMGPNNRARPICVFSFSGPRVGNLRFKERLEELGVKVLRILNVHDIIPKAPGLVFNENSPSEWMKIVKGLPWSYYHVGSELALDHKNSPFLKDTIDPSCAHNLEAILHLIDGYHGKGKRFHLTIGRDIALVNKASDFLKDHFEIPPFWRQDENKGMVRTRDGRWIQAERAILDDHPDYTYHHLKQLGLFHGH